MKEHTTSKVPQIRFKGFEDGWLEDQLEERVEFFSGLTYSPRNVQKGVGTLVLRSSNVKNGEIVNADNVYVDPKIVNSKYVEVGDIAVVVRNGSRSLIGKHAQIKNRMDNTVIGAFMTGIHSENPTFTNALLDTPQFDKEIAKNLGATINQITTGAFRQMMFRFPRRTEQTQIGEYFRELDRLIGLHQRKHDKLVKLKKAMLQKMFPQPGATTPEIRFKGFSEAWKEKELGELVNFFKGKGLSKSEIDPSGTEPCIHYGQLFTEYSEVISNVISRAKGGNSYFRSIANDVLMPTSDVTPRGLAKASAINESDVIIGGDILVIRGDKKLLLGSFLSRYIRYMESQVLQMVSGSTVFHLYSSSMEKFRVKYPSVSEQQKIGSYFRTLDKLISKHASQLQKLKQIKSACLEKMFV